MFGQREFAYRKHKFYNRNPLLSLDMGVDGLKTGHTTEAGYGLVASAVRDGRHLVWRRHGTSEGEKDRRDEAKKHDRLGLQPARRVSNSSMREKRWAKPICLGWRANTMFR